jgi:hypothetical protein
MDGLGATRSSKELLLRMARDYYADGAEIAERLREEHAFGWAERIDQSIDEGFTATEILMRLRNDLAALLAADLPIQRSTLALAQDLRAAIDSALSA